MRRGRHTSDTIIAALDAAFDDLNRRVRARYTAVFHTPMVATDQWAWNLTHD